MRTSQSIVSPWVLSSSTSKKTLRTERMRIGVCIFACVRARLLQKPCTPPRPKTKPTDAKAYLPLRFHLVSKATCLPRNVIDLTSAPVSFSHRAALCDSSLAELGRRPFWPTGLPSKERMRRMAAWGGLFSRQELSQVLECTRLTRHHKPVLGKSTHETSQTNCSIFWSS